MVERLQISPEDQVEKQRHRSPVLHCNGTTFPSAVLTTGFEQRSTPGGSVAGGRTWRATLTSPLDGVATAVAVAGGIAEMLGLRGASAVPEEHAHTSNTTAELATAAQLSLHRGRDLVSRKVIEPVIVRSHALREVGAGIDRIRLVHRRNSRQVLDGRQMAVIAC